MMKLRKSKNNYLPLHIYRKKIKEYIPYPLLLTHVRALFRLDTQAPISMC